MNEISNISSLFILAYETKGYRFILSYDDEGYYEIQRDSDVMNPVVFTNRDAFVKCYNDNNDTILGTYKMYDTVFENDDKPKDFDVVLYEYHNGHLPYEASTDCREVIDEFTISRRM